MFHVGLQERATNTGKTGVLVRPLVNCKSRRGRSRERGQFRKKRPCNCRVNIKSSRAAHDISTTTRRTMTALDTLRTLNKSPVLAAINNRIAKLKRAAKPVAPLATRCLIVSTFIEDALRTLGELPSQQLFFHHALGIPPALSKALIIPAALISLIAAGLFMYPPTHVRGAKALLGCVVYQQLMYGRHSAITTGNLGFLVRNLCMSGTLALFLTVPKRNTEQPVLPGASAGARIRRGARDNAALLVRVLFAFACFEMFDVVGWGWAVLIMPTAGALVFGYQAELCAMLLLAFYAVGAIVANPFWTVAVIDKEMAHMRELMRYEFVQTVSILGGLLLIIMSGPGAFSVDNKLQQGKAW